MSQIGRHFESRDSRPLHELLFSINAGLVFTVSMFTLGPKPVVYWAYDQNAVIRTLLHLRQTDLASFGFLFAILAAVVSILVWGGIHILRNIPLIERALPLASGLIVISALPLLWCYGNNLWITGLNAQGLLQLLEAGLALVGVVVYTFRKWIAPTWVIITIIGFHFALWSSVFGLFDGLANFFRYRVFRASDLLIPAGAPAALIVAFASAICWVLSLRRAGGWRIDSGS